MREPQYREFIIKITSFEQHKNMIPFRRVPLSADIKESHSTYVCVFLMPANFIWKLRYPSPRMSFAKMGNRKFSISQKLEFQIFSLYQRELIVYTDCNSIYQGRRFFRKIKSLGR